MTEDLWVSLVVIGVTGGLIGLLFLFLNHRKRQKESALRQAALERGWQVELIRERLVSGYRLSGQDRQGSWVLEIRTTASEQTADAGSSGVSHSTRWWNSAVQLQDRAVVMSPSPGMGGKMGPAALFQGPGGGLVQAALRAMLGKDAHWLSQLTPVEVGSDSFRARILCLAQDSQDVEQLLTPEIESRVLKMAEKRKPVIKLDASGLEIHLPTEQVTEPSEMETIISLGDALGRAWQGR